MKTIKIIDLLNKIANGEEVPKKIKWGVHELDLYIYDYKVKNELGNLSFTDLLENVFNRHALNEQIEILEEESRDIEVCGSLFTKSEYDKLAHSEEEKKVPEKLKIEQNSIGNYYIKNEYGTKCNLTKHSKIIIDKINEVLDYLESKGD